MLISIHSRWVAVLFALFILTGCALSEEPPIVSTAALPTVTPTVPPDIGRPIERIDLERGAEIFTGAQSCQLCHGLTGEGNGPVAANIACPLVSFTDAIANQSKALTAWFALVSNGNNGTNACPMPPWKNQLNEQDRWNVTSYVYSLHYTPERFALGEEVWQQQCLACHSETGAAAVPQLAVDLSDPAALINRSDTQLYRLLGEGLPDGSHNFAALTEAERWAVVAYTRSLGWDNLDLVTAPPQTPTAVAAIPDTPTITVNGTVSNGTEGAAIPANVSLTLRVIEATAAGFNDAVRLDTVTRADGSFSFPDVPRRNGLVYVISTTYAGVLQTSNVISLQTGSGPAIDLSFAVYETTDDATDIRVEVQRIFVDFPSPTSALIQQGILFRNSGDRIYVGDGDAVLQFQLPVEATGISLTQESRGFQIANGSIIQSALPFAPGELTLQFSYQLPLAGSVTVSQPTRYEVEQLSVHVPQGGSAFVSSAGYRRDQSIQLESGVYETYALVRPVPAGDNVTFSVRLGSPDDERRNLLAVLLFAAMILIGGMALAIWRLERSRK